jgi:hypothetical protein
MSESVVLCEGYLDRAFWAGWFEHLGCEVPPKSGGVIQDELGRPVHKGQHMYLSASARFIRVVPCGGKPEVRREARQRLAQRTMQPQLSRLVVSVDPDVDAQEATAATGLRLQDLTALARDFDPQASETPDGDVSLDGGATLVSLVRWEAEDQDAAGVPTRQTLERLVCGSLVATYPDRGPAVRQWLKSRPNPPPTNPKEFAWSHMAGWYAEQGCEAFYRVVWSDEAVADELRTRLRQCGAWRVAEAVAE